MAQSEARWANLLGVDHEDRQLNSDEFRVVVCTWRMAENQQIYGAWMRRSFVSPIMMRLGTIRSTPLVAEWKQLHGSGCHRLLSNGMVDPP